MLYLILFLVHMCMHVSVYVSQNMQRQEDSLQEFVLSTMCVKRSNADPPTWQQAPLPTKLFHPARSLRAYI